MATTIDWTRLQQAVGDPSLQPREREFAKIVQEYLNDGIIPGPTRLNNDMGLKQRRNTNMLSGRFARIRRFLFEEAGLIEPTAFHVRWEWQKGDWRYTKKPIR